MQFQSIDQVKGLHVENGKLTIKTNEAEVHVYIYSESIIRVNITRNPNKPDHSFAVIQNPFHTINVKETSESVEVNTSVLKLIITKKPLRINFYTQTNRPLSEDDIRFGTGWQGEKVITYRKLYADEKFIGLGEKTGNLNRRGTSYVNWNTDASHYDHKTDPLYKTIPFFIGLHSGSCYGLFMDNPQKSYFDFGATTDEEMSWFGADGGDMNYYFFGSQTIAKILEDYTWLTGRPEMPPLWSLGYQQCRWSYMSAYEVFEIAETFRKKQIPADVIYCDIDYMNNYKIFTWSPKEFPDPKLLIDKLKAIDFHLVTIVDPGIKVEEGYKQYDEGIKNEYFAKYPNGDNYIANVWPGRCHFPNFFNPDVRKWWGDSFTALTEPGVEGFWNDMNEPAAWGQNMPSLVKFGDHYMPEVRNAYGSEMAKATYEGAKKLLNKKRPFVLTRAAYSGIQRYSAVWTGDNTANDEQLLLGQRLVNSIGLSGISLIGVDIGGFMGDPTPELMVRWNSLGVYIPMFRNHTAMGMKMREPWQWGAKNEKTIKKDIEQRYKLLPYIYSAFYQSQETGLPVSRSLAINYTDDENVFDLKYQNQFLFGDAILIAPVKSTQTSADVYFPTGDWYRLSSDKIYSGNTNYEVKAPLTDLPVFVKAGSIIPMQHIIQSTSETGDGILELHIWQGNENSEFVYYEDDGITYDYQDGTYYKRTINFNPSDKTIVISAVEGSYNSRFNQIQIVFHGFDKLVSISIDNKNIKASKARFENITREIEIKF